MIKTLLTPDPNKRPEINDVLKHDYLSSENISKDHLLEYISKKPLANASSQKDPHESNVMPLSRNGNIPREDCKLDATNKAENIFQKGFRLGPCDIGARIVRKYHFDHTLGNSNTPEKELKLDIERKSNFILERVETTLCFLADCEPKRIPSSEMSSIAPSPHVRSRHFVSKWVDLKRMFGFGYQLSDSSIGAFFNDGSHLVADCNMKNFQYVDKNGVREYFEYDRCPTRLDHKLKQYKRFKGYLENGSSTDSPVEEKEIKVVDGGIPILLKWKRDDNCICFLLFNGVLQVNFFEDDTKFIVSLPTKSISIIDKDNKLKNYCCDMLAAHGWDEFLEEKMSRVKRIVEKWLPHKRKHEDDDNSVPRKKIHLVDDF
uniref:Polo kinase n=1 Tax=Strongyloides papillosus TaxID=174720 RepID=A0A0N5C4V2_STREA